MSEFISQAKAAWVGARQRDFHKRTRGIMTPEQRRVVEDTFDAALAAHAREVAARAWNEGRRSAHLEYEHIFNGHPVAEGEMCDECASLSANPYQDKETSDANMRIHP